jgi:flavin-dependent dehydrogenase
VEAQHQQFPGLRGRLPDLCAEPPVWLASGPFDRPVRKVVDHGVALVGDAAGYFDPFTGQGIYQAMIGAERLAAVASAALAHAGIVSRGRLAPYAATHARLTRGPRGVQRLIDAVLARVATGNAAIRLLARSRTLRTTLLGVTADLLPPHALLDPRCVTACIHALLRPT